MTAPLYKQIFQYVVNEIENGRFAEGDRIPSEAALADQFGVSRITSKKALTELARTGLITRIRGKGSFVSIRQGKQPTMLHSLYTPATVVGLIKRGRAAARLIGLVIPGFNDAYGTELVQSIERHVSAQGFHLVLKQSNGDLGAEQIAIEACLTAGVEGLIVFPAHGEHYNAKLLRLVLDGFPLVLVDRYLRGIDACSVYSDNMSAAKELTEHLLNRGHRQIAFVSPPAENTSTIEERLLGFMQAFSDHALHISPQWIYTDVLSAMPQHFNAETFERDRQALRQFLLRSPQLTAVVASELYIAEMLTSVVHSESNIPNCTIVCFDASHETLLPQRFAHIQQNQEDMGRRAVELLLMQIAHEGVPSRTTVDFQLYQTDSGAKSVT